MRELGRVYAGCRERITELVRPLGPRAPLITVPACPEWSVHDLVAHMVGSADDAITGRFDGAPSDAWTAVHVEARRGRPTEDVLAEWGELTPRMEEMIDEEIHPGPLHFRLEEVATSEVFSHEHDIRAALNAPGARESAALPVGIAFYAGNRIEAAESLGCSLRIRVIGGEEFGAADAVLTLTGEPFELVRALSGRRSVGQLRKLDWIGDPDLIISDFEHSIALRPPPEPLEE